MSLPCIRRDIICMQPVHIFLLRVSMCPKRCEIVCLTITHEMLQSVIVSGAMIFHISSVNGVLQYCIVYYKFNFPGCTTQLFKGPNMLVSDFENIITKPIPAALMLSPFGFFGDILKLVYTTSSCGDMVSATSRKPAISIETIAHRL